MAFAVVLSQAQTVTCNWYTVCNAGTWDTEIAANPKSTAIASETAEAYFGDIDFESIYNSYQNEIVLNKYILNDAGKRIPSDAADLTAKAKIAWDGDYLYVFLNVDDNSILKTGFATGDAFELQIAPYLEAPGKITNEEKYAYWNDLGARKLHIGLDNLVGENNREAGLTDVAPSEGYLGCYAFSANKSSGSGYYALFLVNFYDAMNQYSPTINEEITFELKVLDRDAGSAAMVQAAWNSSNNDSYATIIYNGKLKFGPSVTSNMEITADASLAYPNPVSDVLSFSTEVAKVSIMDVAGVEVLSAQNVSSINVESLNAGLYIIKYSNDGINTITEKIIKK